MKRQLIFLMIILPLSSLFSFLEIYAQPGTGELPGTKSSAPPPQKTKTASAKGSTKGGSNAPVVMPLNLGEERKGRLDASTKDPDGSFYEEMTLNAKSEDWLSFHVESDNPDLELRIIDINKDEVPIAKDPSGAFRLSTPTGGLPVDGQYRVRVTGAVGKTPIPFKIKVDRLGLTSIAYAERFSSIYSNYKKDDPASVQETVSKLEELGRDDPNRSTAFETLGIIYIDNNDVDKAALAMEQSLKAKGLAVFLISFDKQWRRLTKSTSGDFGFAEHRSGWLKIGPGKVTITDLAGKELENLSANEIKTLSRTLVSAYNLVTIVSTTRKQLNFAPKSMRQAEADLVIKLIENYVN
jgi:hypothetical protein